MAQRYYGGNGIRRAAITPLTLKGVTSEGAARAAEQIKAGMAAESAGLKRGDRTAAVIGGIGSETHSL